jgi:predicted transcriptional regulator of viral defense system
MLLDRLYEVAADQLGYITTSAAREVGVGARALHALARRGRLAHVSHGVYRLQRFPESELDHYMEALLWPLTEPVALGLETALVLYDISDANPDFVSVIVPLSYRTHREVPPHMKLHPAHLEPDDVWDWKGLKVTSPIRTLLDCQRAGVRSDLVEAARVEAMEQGLVDSGGWRADDDAT